MVGSSSSRASPSRRISSIRFCPGTSTTPCRSSPTASRLESCSALSLALDEPLFATASEASAWLLVEQPGPWGRKALTESRLDPEIGATLERRCKELGIKVLLVKRPGRDGRHTRRCYLGWSGQGRALLEEAPLDGPEALLELPLARLAAGEQLALGPWTGGPLYLVCTNGRRDPCCARQGRALFRALAERFPDRVWECSHLGGHRFAANLVCLPDGLWFGRADVAAAEEYEQGRILLRAFRGRSSFAAAAQAADWFVRERDGLLGVDELTLERLEGDEVVLRGPETRYRVRVVRGEADRARPISCGEEKLERPPAWSLAEIKRARLGP